jgi:excisionase family DNA binding protein
MHTSLAASVLSDAPDAARIVDDAPNADGAGGDAPDAVTRILGSKLLFSVEEARAVLRMSRNWAYVLMRTGRLQYIRAGSRRRITRAELERVLRHGTGLTPA